jgi:hypothetical protein
MTFTPVLTKASEGTDNAGPTPDPGIQPPPVWTERP